MLLFFVYSTPGHWKIWFKAEYSLETILSCGWKKEELSKNLVGGRGRKLNLLYNSLK